MKHYYFQVIILWAIILCNIQLTSCQKNNSYDDFVNERYEAYSFSTNNAYYPLLVIIKLPATQNDTRLKIGKDIITLSNELTYSYFSTQTKVPKISIIINNEYKSIKVKNGNNILKINLVGDNHYHLDFFSNQIERIFFQLSKPTLKKLEVNLINVLGFHNLIEKRKVFTLQENTLSEISVSAEKYFNSIFYPRIWAQIILDLKLPLKIAYYTHLTANLWHFGNIIRKNRTGCVQANEQIISDLIYREYNNEKPIFWKTARGLRDFLQSEIGCCTDHALFVKIFMDGINIPSRRVFIPGHWINEVKYNNGENYIIDGSSNLIISGTVEGLLNGNYRQIWLFYNSKMDYDAWPTFPTHSFIMGLTDSTIQKGAKIIYYNGYRSNKIYYNEVAQIQGK